jgi:hypothetical protein
MEDRIPGTSTYGIGCLPWMVLLIFARDCMDIPAYGSE